METLFDVLTQYAEENLVSRLLRETAPQLRVAQLRADRAAEALRALTPEAGDRAEQLKAALEQVHSFREQAILLSGISIGLTLGRI